MKKKDKIKPRSSQDTVKGDHIYFNSKDGPHSAEVISSGKHGVTVNHNGSPHKVKWHHVLGHKKRNSQKFDVVDEGEDGLIVQDESGQRKYLSVPSKSREEKMVLGKSLSNGRMILFAKSGAIANRPGLSLQQKTDKNGNQSNRWVRVNKDDSIHSSNSNQSDDSIPSHIGFVNGEHSGHGKVVSSGEHGHTIKDGSGGMHRVPHAAVTHEWRGDGSPDRSPHDSKDDDASKNSEEIARALFNTSEIDKLPQKAFQPVDSWEELSKKAPEALKEFKGMLDKVAKSLDLVTGKRPQSFDHAVQSEKENSEKNGRTPEELNQDDYMLPENWDSDKGFLFIGPLKGEKRAKEKVASDYVTADKPNGDWSQVRDMVRATIAVPMVTQIPKVLEELKKAGIELAQKPKNNLVKPLPGGYRDINMIVRMPDGFLAELQIHIKPMTLAKEKGHGPYEKTRSIEAKYTSNGQLKDREHWSQSDRDEHAKYTKEQEKLYGDAWDKAQNSPDLTKSLCQPMIILWHKKGG